MPGVESVLLLVILNTVPLFLLGGLLLTRFLSILTGETRSHFSLSRSQWSDFSEFGGSMPTTSGAIFGILAGNVMETSLILFLAATVLFTDIIGFEGFLRGSAFAVLIGIGFAIKAFEWAEYSIRESDVYRGYW